MLVPNLSGSFQITQIRQTANGKPEGKRYQKRQLDSLLKCHRLPRIAFQIAVSVAGVGRALPFSMLLIVGRDRRARHANWDCVSCLRIRQTTMDSPSVRCLGSLIGLFIRCLVICKNNITEYTQRQGLVFVAGLD